MSLLTVVLLGVLVWLLLLVVLTAVFVVGTRQRQRDDATEIETWQEPERRGGGERRIGLPDPRLLQIERRRGTDRRRRATVA